MTAYTEAEVLLTVDNVSKEYNGHLVLRGVQAQIKDIRVPGRICGQVVGFLGSSGIGKSTLFRIMAGLEPPTSGAVRLDDSPLPVTAGEVGVVAQDYPLFAHRTVLGNLLLAARKVLPAHEAYDRAIAALTDFGLADQVHHYPRQLSGGQRQRVAILQQVLAGSSLILMDEPFSGLDPLAKKKTQQLIRRVADLAEKNTIVVISHDIRAVCGIADHLWVLGTETDASGSSIPGARMMGTYNLIELGFAWRDGLEQDHDFVDFVHSIEQGFFSAH